MLAPIAVRLIFIPSYFADLMASFLINSEFLNGCCWIICEFVTHFGLVPFIGHPKSLWQSGG
jgi:hypothetical protein